MMIMKPYSIVMSLLVGTMSATVVISFSSTRNSIRSVLAKPIDDRQLGPSSAPLHLFLEPSSSLSTALNNEDDPYNEQRYGASHWWHNMKSLPRSSILKTIREPVLCITAWSVVVSAIHQWLLLAGRTGMAQCMTLSSKPHSLLVNALGLLLVFRTNTAYQRFAEGRVIWEKILSISRNLSRMVTLYEPEFGAARRRRIQRLLAAFPYTLRNHIQQRRRPTLDHEEDEYIRQLLGLEQQDERHDSPPDAAASSRVGLRHEEPHCNGRVDVDSNSRRRRWSLPWSVLPESAWRKCVSSRNRPMWICDRLAQEIMDVEYTPNYSSRERGTFVSYVDKLSQCIGACERIHQTAVPLNYARHSLRSLTLWLWGLPFALVGDLQLWTGPVMAVTSWMLLGVYQIGYTIEDPFQGSLRLSLLCNAVYRDVLFDMNDEQGSVEERSSAFVLDDDDETQDDWESLSDPQPQQDEEPLFLRP